jgi:transcriptional regulator with XRE-family HTH domain
MQEAGRKLRRARERLQLKYRDVEEASQRIASSRGREEFAIGLSRLADIENKGTVPSIYRLYSLCAIYGLDLSTVLEWYGVDLSHLPGDSATLSLSQTRPVDFHIPERASTQLPCELDFAFDAQRTSFLSRHIQRWGKFPLMLLGSTELRDQRYGLIGSDDWSMHPLIAPGSLVQIDESKRRILNEGWMYELDRPIYFLEDRTGFKCRWCTEKNGFLIAQPYSTSQAQLEVFRFPGEIDVVGQVVGVAMRLDQVRRRHTRS